MQNRYGYFKRVNGVFYALDLQTQRQSSLSTRCEAEAKRLVAAKNQASDTPQLNRAMAKVYASATSPELMTRTWTEVMAAYASKSANGSRERVERAMRSQPFALLKKLRVNETDASVFFAVLNHKRAGNSTNHYCPSTMLGAGPIRTRKPLCRIHGWQTGIFGPIFQWSFVPIT